MLRRPPELPRSVNRPLNRLATSIFSATGPEDSKNSIAVAKKPARIEIEYSSSLPLQMLLSFNNCFFPFWALSFIFILPLLAPNSSNQHVILMVFGFGFKFIIECIRLYLGYAGNLAERMPELTAFCLLTILFQIPLTIFLFVYPLVTAAYGLKMPLVSAIEIIYMAFLLFESIFGVYAVRVMVAAQSSRFHYRQFEKLPMSPSPEGTPRF